MRSEAMKTIPALALGLLFGLALSPQLSAAPQFGARDRNQNRDRVCVYQDIHYQGWEQCYNEGDEVTSLDRRNNAVSSIRIFGRAAAVVYRDIEYRGESITIDRDVPDLRQLTGRNVRSWDRQISSIAIESERSPGRGRGRGRGRF